MIPDLTERSNRLKTFQFRQFSALPSIGTDLPPNSSSHSNFVLGEQVLVVPEDNVVDEEFQPLFPGLDDLVDCKHALPHLQRRSHCNILKASKRTKDSVVAVSDLQVLYKEKRFRKLGVTRQCCFMIHCLVQRKPGELTSSMSNV